MVVDPTWPAKFTQDQWERFTAKLEGGPEVNIMFMVQDAQVATGYGLTWTGRNKANLGKIEAKRLQWSYKLGHPQALQSCSPADVDADYDNALDAPPSLYKVNGQLPAWRKIMQCETNAVSLRKELLRRALINIRTMRNTPIIRNWDDLPADAQMCIISMTWAFGPNWDKVSGGLLQKLTSFRAAVEALDFDRAGQLAGFKDNVNSLGDRAKAQAWMLVNAQRVVMQRLTYDDLHWPDIVPLVVSPGIVSGIAGPPDPRDRFGGQGAAGRFN